MAPVNDCMKRYRERLKEDREKYQAHLEKECQRDKQGRHILKNNTAKNPPLEEAN